MSQHLYSSNTIQAFVAKHCEGLSHVQLALVGKARYAKCEGTLDAPEVVELYASTSLTIRPLMRFAKVDGVMTVTHMTEIVRLPSAPIGTWAHYYDHPGFGWLMLCHLKKPTNPETCDEQG